MYFYDFNIGEYAKKTAHLTNEEDIAYRRAIDLYYDTEKPLDTQNIPSLSRRLRVNAEALKNVLDEFFPDGVNKHCEEKIATYYAFIDKQKANGLKGGRPKRTQALANTNPKEPKPKPSLPTNHLPLTTNQEPLTKTSKSKDLSAPLAQTAKKGTRLPEDWQLSKPWGEWAASEKANWTTEDIRRVAADFKDHWLAKAGKDAVKMDWLATWRKWVRSPLNEVKPPSKGNARIQESRLDFMEQLFGGKNGTDRQIIDITDARTIEGNGAHIQEIGNGIRESDGGEMGRA